MPCGPFFEGMFLAAEGSNPPMHLGHRVGGPCPDTEAVLALWLDCVMPQKFSCRATFQVVLVVIPIPSRRRQSDPLCVLF